MSERNDRTEIRVMQAKELRFLPVEEGPESGNTLAGYAAVFNADSEDLGGFVETIDPAAFNRSLAAGADVRALINHDSNLVLGRSTSGTLRLSTDEIGLRFEVDLPETSYARDLKVSMERGDISQCSFMFQVVKDEWVSRDGIARRRLLDVDLMDVSVVTFPAYPQTTAGVRALAEQMRNTGEGGPEPMAEETPQERADDSALKMKITILEKL